MPTASQQGYSTSTRNKKVDGTLTSYEDSGLAAKCWKNICHINFLHSVGATCSGSTLSEPSMESVNRGLMGKAQRFAGSTGFRVIFLACFIT